MLTDVQIINLGLSKISESRIDRIDPARTGNERYMATNYPQWKRSELAKRRWVFATVDNYKLTLNQKIEGVDKPYKYLLPSDCLRPIRNKYDEWQQRGRYVYSNQATLSISYIQNVPEADFDPLFNDVLACRIAYESCEFITQSKTKRDTLKEEYIDTIRAAGQANAFVIGPEDIGSDDTEFSWLGARING